MNTSVVCSDPAGTLHFILLYLGLDPISCSTNRRVKNALPKHIKNIFFKRYNFLITINNTFWCMLRFKNNILHIKYFPTNGNTWQWPTWSINYYRIFSTCLMHNPLLYRIFSYILIYNIIIFLIYGISGVVF